MNTGHEQNERYPGPVLLLLYLSLLTGCMIFFVGVYQVAAWIRSIVQ